jgi:hypothetical protein
VVFSGSTIRVIFAFLALFAVNCFQGFFFAKYAKSRKGAQRGSRILRPAL